MQENEKKVYHIRFFSDMPNWVSMSTIDKETLDEFIQYLYSLERRIVVLPYVCGGGGPVSSDPTTDRTYIPRAIAEGISKKVDIDTLLNENISHGLADKTNCYGIHFMEDVYEFYRSLGIENFRAYSAAIKQYHRNDNEEHLSYGELKDNEKLQEFAKWIGYESGYKHYPYQSRWVFVYMFRNEFKRFMEEKGYQVVVDGGWVLNNKFREVKLGLINENGDLY